MKEEIATYAPIVPRFAPTEEAMRLMVFFGNDSLALPFYTNDCRSGCGTPGWYELHTIVWDQVRQQVGFEILRPTD